MATKRIEYIDAMRGFTILLVVYGHILTFGYQLPSLGGGEEIPCFNQIIRLFRMPLFFFISGFILFKKDITWNWETSRSFLLKKAKVQLVPTIFFLWLYTSIIAEIPLFDALKDNLKSGYWFTISLFEYFCIYISFRWFCYKSGKKDGTDWLLIGIGLFLYASSTNLGKAILHLESIPLSGFLGIQQSKYFIFFAIGTITKKYFRQAEHALDNGKATAIMLLSFFLTALFILKYGEIKNPLFFHLYLLFMGVCGLLLTFAFFRKYQEAFTSETITGKILQYIGRRTLDIYLLHYFFLPYNLKRIGIFFAEHPNPTLEFVTTFTLAIIITAICLLMSNIIRVSPVLEHWLFGVKKSR